MERFWKCTWNEKYVVNQANRLVKLENPTRDDLMTIKEEDVFDR